MNARLDVFNVSELSIVSLVCWTRQVRVWLMLKLKSVNSQGVYATGASALNVFVIETIECSRRFQSRSWVQNTGQKKDLVVSVSYVCLVDSAVHRKTSKLRRSWE